MKYEVKILYEGQSTFIVDANSREEAESVAIEKYQNDELPDNTGDDFETFWRVTVIGD